VPHFVINGVLAVPGAQDVKTLLGALERAWERTEGSKAAGATST
jgi:predicted DsbA family dithiol-disulfide isomerase